LDHVWSFNFISILSTIYQLIRRVSLKKKSHKRVPALSNSPHARGTVRRARIVTPRKPNSARRPVAKVMLVNGYRITAHIPGVGHNLRSHSQVLVRGGGARDLPGVRYTCVRGVFDLSGVTGKRRRRSIYGVERPAELKKKVRRKFRNL
jgi:small subunit ribosomal protein S12